MDADMIAPVVAWAAVLYAFSGVTALRRHVREVQLEHEAVLDCAVFFLSPLYWVGAGVEALAEWLRET